MKTLDQQMAEWFNPPGKEGIWRDHTCWRCRDGEQPEKCKHAGNQRNCDTLRARND